MSAPTGNKNAVKDETASSFLHLRCTQAEKASWVKAALRSKKKLTVWVTDVLNAASNAYEDASK